MSFVARIGNVVQTFAEATVEWTVKDLSSLSDKVNSHYESPVFSFADSLWCICLYPNEQYDEETPICVGIYLFRKDSGPPKTIEYSLECKCSNGIEDKTRGKEVISMKIPRSNGRGVYFLREQLLKQASTFSVDDTLTTICHLKCSEENNVKVVQSWTRALQVGSDLKSVLSSGNQSDFTLKLGNRKWPVHRAILEGRSEYFANMFRHEWVENTTGELTLGDINDEAMDNVLVFIYSGDVESLTPGNVCETYAAAHMFMLESLKVLCIECIEETMCEELLCKALALAETYGEEEVRSRVIDYLTENSSTIFDSEKWKEFKKNEPSIVAALFEETVKREREKRTKERIVS